MMPLLFHNPKIRYALTFLLYINTRDSIYTIFVTRENFIFATAGRHKNILRLEFDHFQLKAVKLLLFHLIIPFRIFKTNNARHIYKRITPGKYSLTLCFSISPHVTFTHGANGIRANNNVIRTAGCHKNILRLEFDHFQLKAVKLLLFRCL